MKRYLALSTIPLLGSVITYFSFLSPNSKSAVFYLLAVAIFIGCVLVGLYIADRTYDHRNPAFYMYSFLGVVGSKVFCVVGLLLYYKYGLKLSIDIYHMIPFILMYIYFSTYIAYMFVKIGNKSDFVE